MTSTPLQQAMLAVATHCDRFRAKGTAPACSMLHFMLTDTADMG